MANFRYVTPNALRVRVVRQRRLVLVAGFPIVLGSLAMHPLLGGLSAVAAAALWNRGGRHLYGAVG